MAQFVYVKDFGKFHKGDVVDVPDGAKVPAEFLAPVTTAAQAIALAKPDVDEAARVAAIEEAKKNLAAAEAVEADAHKEGN